MKHGKDRIQHIREEEKEYHERRDKLHHREFRSRRD